MITNFIAVEPQIIADFEKGAADKKTFINTLRKNNILSANTFEIIDFILTEGSEDSPLTIFTGEGEILAGADGEALMFEWIDFENEDGVKYSMCDPAVYKNKEDLEKAVKLSLSTERDAFKNKFNFRKMEDAGVFISDDEEYVRDNENEIISAAYEDFTKIRKFYLDALNAGKYVILFYLYDDEV